MLAMLVFMLVFMLVRMPVMLASGRRCVQLAAKVRRNLGFHRRARRSGTHLDAVMREDIKRPLANPANDDHSDALFAQPQWE